MSTPNRLYFGDCLDVMKQYVEDETVDLIYLDPPFNSKRIYNANMGGAQFVAFADTWKWYEAVDDFHEVAQNVRMADTMEGLRRILGEGSNLAYVSYMANRLLECYRVLTHKGTLYLHCDPVMNYLLRIVLDAIFTDHKGRAFQNEFRNEIVWFYPDTPGRPKKDFPRKHDTIFRYVKSKSGYIFNADDIRVPILEASKKRYESPRVLGGREYTGGESASIGKIPENVWRIPSVKRNSNQSCGYDTQKPVALLDRIVRASSNKNSIVMDPFCGCGTTLEVAHGLDRNWIGIDVCVKACQVIQERFEGSFDSVWSDSSVDIIGMPKTVKDAYAMAEMDPFKFEKWAASLTPWMEANKKQRGDGGIDGRGRYPLKKGTFVDMVCQVKGGHTSPSHIQAFNGARQQAHADMGIFTCFQDRVTDGMKDAAASAGSYLGAPIIQIYTVEDFFEHRNPKYPQRHLAT